MDERNPVPGSVKDEREYLRFLVRTGELLASSLDYRETLMNVCAAAVDTIADFCFLAMDAGAGRIEILASAARDPALLPEVATAGRFLKAEPGRPAHLLYQVMRDSTVLFVPEVTDRFIDEHATSAQHARYMRELGYGSIIVVPIRAPVLGVVGALALVRSRGTSARFDADALLFAEDLSRRCGGAISRSRAYEESQRIAEHFQRAALPRSLPAVPGARFDAYYEPAESTLLVGGDWYDAFALPNGTIGITVGDVTGHGVDAAAFMGIARNTLRTALCAGLPLAHALRVADYLVRMQFAEGEYATANISILDPATGILRTISAGHPGPLIHRPGDSVVDPFQERGLPLGLRDLSDDPQPVEEIELAGGAFVVYFTDGVIEWERNELRGYEQLKAAMMDRSIRVSEQPAYELRKAVVRGPHADDIAIMCVQIAEG